MHLLAVSATFFLAAGAFPTLAPNSTNTTLPEANPSSANSFFALISGGHVPTKRDNVLDAVTRAIDNLENTLLSLGGLVNSSPTTMKRDDNSVTSVAGQAIDGDQLAAGNTANLINERSEKRDNAFFVVTRVIDDIENTILALGRLTNNPSTSKREADNSVTSDAQQATDNSQSTAQSSANLINAKRDNFLDVITRAIDDLENTSLALGSLLNGNTNSKSKRMDDSASAIIQGAIDGIQSAIGALASLTTSN